MSEGTKSQSVIKKIVNFIIGLVEGLFGLFLFIFSQFIAVFAFMFLNIDTDVYEGTYSFVTAIITLIFLGVYVFLRSIGRKKNNPYIYHDKLTASKVIPVVIMAFGIMGIVLYYFIAADYLAEMFDKVKDEMDIYTESVDRYSEVSAEVVPYFDNWLNLIAICVIVPIIEELTFRGILLGELLRKTHPAVAIFVSALTFGLMHGISVQIGYALICGIFIGCIYYFTHSIWASILFHALFNLFGSGIATLLESGMFGDQTVLGDTISSVYTFLCLMLVVPSIISLWYLYMKHKKANSEALVNE